MAESAYVRRLAVPDAKIEHPPRHSAVVCVTHWIAAIFIFSLLLSGISILLAHPRLYWGEAGNLGTPSLIDLPLPFVLDIPIRGPGRYLHFLSAWILVLVGLYYVLSGLFSGHFGKNLLPSRTEVGWKSVRRILSNHLHLRRPTEEESLTYNVVQRLTYLGVVFILVPLMIWTGLAMSPAVTSVFPVLASVLGGQQSARTLHFFLTCVLIIFLVIHIAAVCLAGFKDRVRAMITGRRAAGKEPL